MKILFVCGGNTGRSPMAQFVMKKLVDDAGLSEKISVSSAASKKTDGGALHHGIADKLRDEKIPFGEHFAHEITQNDYDTSDFVICMDDSCAAEVKNRFGDAKVTKLLTKDIPWDKNGFETTFADILSGCKSLLSKIEAKIDA